MPRNSCGLGLGTRGLHSEGGGGRGLTARMLSVLKPDYQFQISLSSIFKKISKIFWGPEDFLRINKDEVVWYTKLDPKGQMFQTIKNNPDLNQAMTGQQLPPPTGQINTPTENQATGTPENTLPQQ